MGHEDPTVSEMRAREFLQTLKFKEERELIASMTEDEYRSYLREKLGDSNWARKEIDLLVRAKRDTESFNNGFVTMNHLRPIEPIEKDFRSYLKDSVAKEHEDGE